MIDLKLVSESTPTELVLLLIAFVLSAVIGVERQRKLKSAGLRTHTLVGLGSAVFTIVSAYGFSNVIGPDVTLDPSRIAAQIVSGIGFLGAGVIFVRQNVVSGLTTAASIWVTAAVGMACGAGMPLLAVAATLLHLTTVILLTILGKYIPTIDKDQIVVLRYKEGMGVLRMVLLTANQLGFEVSLTDTRQLDHPGRVPRFEANMRFSGRRPLGDLVEGLSGIKGVTGVHLARDEND